MEKKTKFKEVLNREMLVLFGLVSASAVWFVILSFVVPFFYELLSREIAADYSYLWNGVSERVVASSIFGPLVLAAFYLFYLAARLLKWLARVLVEDHGRAVKPARPIFDDEKERRPGAWGVLVRELATLIVVVVVSGAFLYSSRNSYLQMKEQYFVDVVAQDDRYQNLSVRQKKLAMSQYEEKNADEIVDGMLRDYGFRAQAAYYLQWISFWCLIWGYPGLLALRSILWTLRTLREEE